MDTGSIYFFGDVSQSFFEYVDTSCIGIGLYEIGAIDDETCDSQYHKREDKNSYNDSYERFSSFTCSHFEIWIFSIYFFYCIFFLSFVKNMLQKISKQAYTLVELIIAVSISAVVLIIIFFFVTDSLVQLSETEKGSRFLTDFARFSSQLQSQSTTFPNASFLIDNTSTSGFDIILLQREP